MSGYIEDQLKSTGVAQVIVVLKQPADTAAAGAALRNHFHLAETATQSGVAHGVALSTGGGRGKRAIGKPQAMRVYPHLGLMLGVVDRAGLAALRHDRQNVKKVVAPPNFSLIRPRVRAVSAVPKKAVTWGIEALEAPALWKKNITGKNILVGHLDTGIDGDHPALKAALAEFAEFDFLGNKIDDAKPRDGGDHGTHTAATIAGRPVKKGGRLRYVGVAPEAMLMSALVIEGGDVIARVLGGMNWAVGKGVRVLNMSLGLRGYHDDFRIVSRILRDRGVLPVFAVGNEYAGTSRSPGNYEEALSVGAMDESRLVADFSSSQRFARANDPVVPDLVGPGVDVISAKPGKDFQSMDGTSMATPHIAGLAALLFQAKPGANPDEVEAAVFDSCEGGVGLPTERANRGFPNAPRALEKLLD